MVQEDDEAISEDITRLGELYQGQVQLMLKSSYTVLTVKIPLPPQLLLLYDISHSITI